ncbi:hypothetical protein [Hyunsoonleella aquatilis]|nr:hypothetical protein [Hyunsoonleella aquatilis]
MSIRKRFVFPILYLLFNIAIIPPIAKSFGREKLPTFSKEIKPRNWCYPLLFRNYVAPNLKKQLQNDASVFYKSTSMPITYLDANFPFIDGFPLFPHLSHNDGKKVDLSLMYLDEKKESTDKKPSVSGYGVYANSEDNYTVKRCRNNGYRQYDFTKYLSFGTIHELDFYQEGTKHLLQQLLSNSSTQKIFIEPHLKQSLGLSNEARIRFHGCQAVRHDDHIHLQIK